MELGPHIKIVRMQRIATCVEDEVCRESGKIAGETNELGSQHVRFHAMLSDELGTLIREEERLLYSFRRLPLRGRNPNP